MSTEPRERNAGSRGRSRDADDTKLMERPSIDRWSPPAVLETPPNVDGYRHRWIAESVNGTPLPQNVQRALRQGYERVLISDLPDGYIVDEDTKGDGVARQGGLILMKIPERLLEQRAEFYRNRRLDSANAANTLTGIPERDAVVEDRSRRLTGAEIRNSI